MYHLPLHASYIVERRFGFKGKIMPQSSETRPSILYWIISLFLLVWGIAGASIYIALLFETPEEFAASAEDAAHAEIYADYVANIPAWAIGAGIIAAAARLLGAVGLLMRRAWALPLYVVSLIFFLAALYRAFVLANAAEAMSPPHIGIQVVFTSLTVFAIWFSLRNNSKGLLR